MKKIFLVGLLLSISILVGFSQKIKTSLQPSEVNGELHFAIIIENNTSEDIAPEECDFVAKIDGANVDLASLDLVYQNPKWSNNVFYSAMTIQRLPPIVDQLFELKINPDSSSINSINPTFSTNLLQGESDTVALFKFQFIDKCLESDINFNLAEARFKKWDYTLSAINRELTTDLNPNGTELFVFGGKTTLVELGNDTLLCAESFGVNQLEVDSTLGALQWSFKSLKTKIITTASADTNNTLVIDSSGTFYLTTTSGYGCVFTDSIKIDQRNAALLQITPTSGAIGVDSVCFDENSMITVSDSEPTSPGFASILWDNGAITASVPANTSGRYSVSIIDSLGCLATDSVKLTVIIPDSVDVLPNAPVTICALDSALLTTTLSGTSVGTYSWTDGSAGATNYVYTTGYQVVTFTDSTTGCTSLDSVLINVIARPTYDTLTVNSTICKSDTLPLYIRSTLASDSVFIYGLNTFTNTKTVVASGIYQTTFNGVDTSDIGTYVYVVDNGTCSIEYTSTINVTDLVTTIIPRTDTICFGDSLLLSLSTSGGKGAYTYNWNQPLSNNNTSTSSTNLSTYFATPGNQGNLNSYRIRVEDAVGCFDYDTVSYYYNKEINISFSDGTNTGMDTIIVCSDGSNARTIPLQAVVTGGTPLLGAKKYKYRWFQDPSRPTTTTLSISQPNSNNPGFIAIAPIPDTIKVYLEVTDLLGCTHLDSVIIKLRVFSIKPIAQNLITCPRMVDTLGVRFILPGSGVYKYRWFKDITSPDTISETDIINPYIKPTISQRVLVEVTDSVLGCSIIDSVRITVVPINGAVSISKSIICVGDTVTLNGSGSKGAVEYKNRTLWPYSHAYKWSKVDAADTAVFVNNYDTTNIVRITNGTPGTTTQYQLIVTDSIGCKDTVVTNVIWNNTLVSQTKLDTFYVCNDDMAQLEATSATGGTVGTGYLYNWKRVKGEVMLPNNGGIKANGMQNPDVYFKVDSISDTSVVSLRVYDSVGCFTDDTTTVINNNLDFEVKPHFTPVCTDFPVKLLVSFLRDSNSTNNYTYNWNDPADANELFQDSLGTTLNTTIRSPFAITDNSQTYELSITDNVSGCSDTSSAEVIIYTLDAIITVDGQIKDTSVVCYLDEIVLSSASSNGGTLFNDPLAPYVYNWYKSSLATDNSATTSASNTKTTSIASFGSEGDNTTWILELTDKAGCKGSDSTVVYWNNEINPIMVDDTVYVCTPDTARLSVNTTTSGGGTAPYNYVWTKMASPTGGGALLLDTKGTDVRVRSIDNDTTIFRVQMKDANNCSAFKNVVVIGVDYRIKTKPSNYSVCQNSNVKLDVEFLEDNIGNFSYLWSPNIEMNDATLKSPTINPTVDRTYTVVVYDSVFKCSATDSVQVKVLDLTAVAVASDRINVDYVIMCANQDSLLIDGRTTFGGTPPYTFSWNSLSSPEVNIIGSSTADTLMITRGIVSTIDTTLLVLTAEDQNGCTDVDSVIIYWNSPVNAAIVQDSLFICSNAPRTLNAAIPTGGTGDYSYNWSVISGGVQLLSAVTANFVEVNTSDDSYVQLSVTDSLGCVGFDTVKIENSTFQITAEAKYDSVCAGMSDTLYVSSIVGGIGGYAYTWSPNKNISNTTVARPVINPTTDTEYTVTVTDSTTGCSAQDAVTVAIYKFKAVAGALGLDTLLRCFDDTNNLNLDASLTNSGIKPYRYSWTTTDATVNFIDNNTNPGVINRSVAGDGSISTIQLLATDNTGCTSTDSVKVLWNSAINIDIDEDIKVGGIVPAVAVCVSVPKVVNNTVTGGSGNYTYNWSLTTATLPKDSGVFIVPSTKINEKPSVGALKLNAQNHLKLDLTDQPITTAGTCLASKTALVVAFDIKVDLKVNEDTVCPNTQVVLTATPRDTVGLIEYKWNNSISYSSSKTSNYTVGATSTVANVNVRDKFTGCTNFDNVNIEVRKLVVSTPERFPKGAICYEQRQVTLIGKASGGKPGNYSYAWKELPFTTVILGTNDTAVVNPPVVATNASTKYRLIVSDMLGCKDSIETAVRRYDSIIVDAGVNDTVCVNDANITLSASASYLSTTGAALNYAWSGGSFVNPTNANAIFRIPEAGGRVQLKVMATIPTTTCSNYDTVIIDVKDLPIADLSNEVSFICADSSLVLHANSTDFNYVYPTKTTFDWRKIGVAGRINTDPNADSINVTSGGTYSVLAESEFGCRNYSAITLDSVLSPLVWAHPLDTLGCTNQQIVLKIDSLKPKRSGELLGDTIRWNKLSGLGYIADNSFQKTVYVPVSSDNFVEIEVTYKNQCGIGRDTVRASIAQAPQASITVNDPTVNLTESVIFDALNSVSFTGNELYHQWSFNVPDLENEYVEGPFEKYYNVDGVFTTELVVTDKNTNCTDTARVNIDVNGTHLLYIPNVFSPNATNLENKTLKMYGVGVSDNSFIFTVFNRWGEKVYEQTSFSQATSFGWDGTYKNSGKALDMGVYTYIVRARYIDGTPIEKVGTITLLR